MSASNSSVESIRPSQASFVDNSPYFEDLNASFKLLFKSIQNKRQIFESGFNNTFENHNNQQHSQSNSNSINPKNLRKNNQSSSSSAASNLNQTNDHIFIEPTLNAINYNDFSKSFDNFVQTIKMASTGELNFNLNEIDTTQFKSKKSYN